jgi:hypothetical protein
MRIPHFRNEGIRYDEAVLDRRMLKKAGFALALAVFTVQTVGWVECCCVLICKHQNDPCKDECKEQPPPQAAAPDCCEKPGAKAPAHRHDEKRCSHVQPSSEIVAPTADVHVEAPPLFLEPPLVLLAPSERPDRDLPLRAARGSPPLLHLLYGALLI